MNKKNVFDMLENAEDDAMDELTENCPDIGDAKFEELLAGSERKYKAHKEEIERTRKDNYIIEADEVTVSGVERISSRPVWFKSLLAAASLFIVAGSVIGTAFLLKRNRGISDNENKPSIAASENEMSLVSTTADTSITTSLTTSVSTTLSSEKKKLYGGTSHTSTASSTSTAVTSKSEVTETTETASEKSAETVQSAAPEKKPVKASNDQGAADITLELYRKHMETFHVMNGSVITDFSDYICFDVDPARNWTGAVPNDGSAAKNKAFYFRVNDSRFSNLNEYVNYLRTVYSEKYLDHTKDIYEDLNCGWIGSGYDELNEGDMMDSPYLILEYRGALYRSSSVGASAAGMGNGKFPVIIENKTDTSFTAFMPQCLDSAEYTDEEDVGHYACDEVKVILDPVYNDWRIDEMIYHNSPVYKQKYDNLG